jgi:hypothetical protein
MVSVSKTGYTFTDDREVSLQPNSNVTGVDFTGSTYATITGRVMAGTTALEGVTVTGTNGGISDDDTTDRRGNFRLSVPSGTVTITAAKTGYDFPSQSIFVGAGETRSIGDIAAMGNMTPLNVEATRDTANGAYDGTVSVSWDAGPGGAATQYQVQTLNDADAWVNANGSSAVMDTTATEFTNAADGAISVRVVAQHDHDNDANTAMVESASPAITVAAINPSTSNVKAARNIDAEPDELDVTWDAVGNTNSNWRVLVRFGAETEWYEAEATATDGAWTVTVTDFGTGTLDAVVADATGKTMTADLANGAMTFRVDYRQGDSEVVDDVETNPWKTGPTAPVDAKPVG